MQTKFTGRPPVPWKDPSHWFHAEIMAPLLSFVLAFFRTIYQDQEPRWLRRFLESALCGLITLSAGFAINAIGVHGDWKYAVAGGIGFLGTEYIRGIAKRFIDRKVDK